MNKYFKISPEWAAKINVTNVAPRHPDGWYLTLPTYAQRIIQHLDPKEDGTPWNVEDAVRAIGGCVYSEYEALASQRGDEEYMMNRTQTEPETEPTDPEIETDPEQVDGEEVTNG